MPSVPHLSRYLALSILLAGLAACGNEGAPAQYVVRDSAGVRIVENRGDAAAERWTLEDRPQVEIAREDSLPPVVQAIRYGGGFVVIDEWEEPLRFYDGSGKPGPNVGSDSRFGPAMVTWVGRLPGDSLGAWDPDARELSVYTPAGRFVRYFAPRRLEGMVWLRADLRGVFGDGAFLVSDEDEALGPRGRAWRPALRLFRVRRDGGVIALGSVPGDARNTGVFAAAEGRTLDFGQPLGPRTFAVPAGDAVYVGTGEAYEIRKLTPSGATSMLIRKRHVPRPLTEADRERERKARMRRVEGHAPRGVAIQRERLAQAVWPETWPAYQDLLTDPAGNLWVADDQGRDEWDDGARWSVFAPDGQWIASVTGPGRFRATEIGDGWVLGVHTARGGTETVRLYGIRGIRVTSPRTIRRD